MNVDSQQVTAELKFGFFDPIDDFIFNNDGTKLICAKNSKGIANDKIKIFDTIGNELVSFNAKNPEKMLINEDETLLLVVSY